MKLHNRADVAELADALDLGSSGATHGSSTLPVRTTQPTPMDEQDFQRRADQSLENLYRKLSTASETFPFEADFNAGALAIEFDDPPGKFVVSPNTPVRQIWVSAHSRSFKLDWDPTREDFVYPETGQNLTELMAGHIATQLGEDVVL